MEERTLFENDKYKLSEKKEDVTRFPPGFNMVWLGPLAELTYALTPRQLRVFLEIAKMNSNGNKAHINPKQIAYFSKIALNHVHAELKVLKGLDVIRVADEGYLLNPDYLWRGNQRDYWNFYYEWKKTKRPKKVIKKLR